jgi:hypothetical protein
VSGGTVYAIVSKTIDCKGLESSNLSSPTERNFSLVFRILFKDYKFLLRLTKIKPTSKKSNVGLIPNFKADFMPYLEYHLGLFLLREGLLAELVVPDPELLLAPELGVLSVQPELVAQV